MRVFAIALNTAREAVRNKILYSVMFFAALLTATAAAVGSVSIGDSIKFVKDFSLFSLSLFGVVTTLLLGVNLLSREIQRRTIYNLLSKPVTRAQFLLGKYLGLLVTLTTMLVLMGTLLLALTGLLEGRIDWQLLPVMGAMLLEVALLLAVALFFGAIVVTPSLAGFFTAATFIAGRSSGWLAFFEDARFPSGLRVLSAVLRACLPHLDRFFVADRVLGGHPLPAGYYIDLLLYTLGYVGLLLFLGATIFRRREFL